MQKDMQKDIQNKVKTDICLIFLITHLYTIITIYNIHIIFKIKIYAK